MSPFEVSNKSADDKLYVIVEDLSACSPPGQQEGCPEGKTLCWIYKHECHTDRVLCSVPECV